MKFFSSIIFFVFFSCFAEAQQITFSENSSLATLSVTAIDPETNQPLDGLILSNEGLNFSFEPDKFFNTLSFRIINFELRWEPTQQNRPALGVQPMKVELPILFRAWNIEPIRIETNYFSGIKENATYGYETMSQISQSFERYFASILIRSYYSSNSSDLEGRFPRRNTVTAVAAADRISKNFGSNWFLPTPSLWDFVNQSMASYPNELKKNVAILEKLTYPLLWEIETITDDQAFLALSCEQIDHFFNRVSQLGRDEPDAAAAAWPDGNFDYIVAEKYAIAQSAANCN